MKRRLSFVLVLLFSCCLFGGMAEAKKPSKSELQKSYLQYINSAYQNAFEYMLIDLNGDGVKECMVGHDALSSGRGYKVSILGYKKKKVICMYNNMGAFTIRFNKKNSRLCFETSSGAMSYKYTILKVNKKSAKIVHSYAQQDNYFYGLRFYKSNDDMLYNRGKEIKEKEFRKVEKNILKWKDITHSSGWKKL